MSKVIKHVTDVLSYIVLFHLWTPIEPGNCLKKTSVGISSRVSKYLTRKVLKYVLGFPAGLSRPGKSREGPGTGTGQDRT